MKTHRLVTVTVTVLIALFALACNDDGTGPIVGQPKAVASVRVQPDSFSLAINGTRQLTAVLKAADSSVITGRTVTWTVSDQVIAQVNSTGTVTALRAGEVDVTASSGGKTGSTRLRVLPIQPAVARIVVNPGDQVLYPGESIQLTARLFAGDNTELPAPPAGNITWSSLDAARASVDANGKVTAHRAGAIWIRATFTNVTGEARLFVPTWYEYSLANGPVKIREYELLHNNLNFRLYRLFVLKSAQMRLGTDERTYEQQFVVETWERRVFNDGSSIVSKVGETTADDYGTAGSIVGVGDFVFRSDRNGATFTGRKGATSLETHQDVPGAVEKFTLIFNRI